MTDATNLPIQDEQAAPRYRMIHLDSAGKVIMTNRIIASDDDEALALACAMASEHAVELWDGLRFLEHFDPAPVLA